MRHQGQIDAGLFGSSNMIWDALAFKRSGIARTRGDKRAQRFAATTIDEIDEGRERILQVAERLIRRFGHQKTTMANIAWELGTSRATLYRYFRTKEALEEQVCAREASRTLRHLRDILLDEDASIERLRVLLLEMGRQTSSRMALEPHLHQLFVEAFRNQWHVAIEYLRQVRALIEDVVARGQADETFVPDDAGKTTKFIFGTMIVFVNPGLTELLKLEDAALSMDLATQVQSLVESIARKTL
ncbi:TetR/AcrR family transcriptional regulator [Ciceribacter selenitireducens]|uniref:TetR/AcrR family transcriptional regulator n=1 Tax=Ciceribacter selenitireducens TaxID=448181 RepID=UPI000687E40B|nr:TetR/AcrR family transcriptional regulator [Ciceribacter selenitireducens]